jgi:hypothetical protein
MARMEKVKIGILYICTGNYTVFWKDFYESMEKYFATDAEKHYFVFTDADHIEHGVDAAGNKNPYIHRIYQKNLGWPGNTLKRFHMFLGIEEELAKLDYLFFCNANLQVLQTISASDVLPTGEEKLVATLHPGFYAKPRRKFTYEKNRKSIAYINKSEGERYFAGGFNGGTSSAFISATKKMREQIDADEKNGVVARWHDESHWNRYLVSRTDVKVLSPAFLYPEGWSLPFTQIILVRDKKKLGGHNTMRNSKNSLKDVVITWAKTFIKNLILLAKPTSNTTHFIQKKSLFSTLDQHELNRKNLICITIAFNKSTVIEAQWKQLSENISESFTYIVADNSNDATVSAEIQNYCAQNYISYVKIPNNPFEKNPSRSHGIALNWAYEHIVKKYRPTYFGFIDHDILPFRKTAVTDKVQNGIFGLAQKRNEKWYLWPGFSFFKTCEVIEKPLDFLPCDGLDTGGSNYDVLYKNIDQATLSQLPQYYFDIEKRVKLPAFDHANQNIVETIGDWVHLMRTSNWHGLSPEKSNSTKSIEAAVKTIQEIAL